MRIAFFSDTYLPEINGIATSISHFVEELGRRGHDVLLAVPARCGNAPRQHTVPGLRIENFRSVPSLIYPEYRIATFPTRKARRVLSSFRPDIIHFHTPLTMGLCAVQLAKEFHVPLVGTNHIYITTDNFDYFKAFSKNTAVARMVAYCAVPIARSLYRRSDLWLCPSRTLIENLKQTGHNEGAEYLPNGVPIAERKILDAASKDALRSKYSLKEKVVLHFGRLSAEKNVQEVLRSFSMVRTSVPETSLFIIGDGPSRKYLERLAVDLGMGDDVVFAGRIDHHSLLSSGIIGIGNLFATASTMENHPMTVMEAMFHGLPIVGFREAGMVDLVRENGFLVDRGDTEAFAQRMIELLTNADLSRRMGNASLDLVQEFSIEHVTDTLLALYQTTIHSFSSVSSRKA